MAAGSTIIASMLTTIQALVCGSGARRDIDFCIGTWTVQILPGVKFWGKYLPWFGWQLLRRPDWRFDQPRRYVSLALGVNFVNRAFSNAFRAPPALPRRHMTKIFQVTSAFARCKMMTPGGESWMA